MLGINIGEIRQGLCREKQRAEKGQGRLHRIGKGKHAPATQNPSTSKTQYESEQQCQGASRQCK